MKIDKLSGKNIRTTDSAPNITTLNDDTLKKVVGGDVKLTNPYCEIHDYYLMDATA